jgi:Tfp pilus assembly protein PilX
MKIAHPHRQRGITLVVAMLFLLVLTVFSVAAFTSSSSNQRAAFNMVSRQEATSAAQAVVEQTISSAAFTTNPAAVAADPKPVDIDGDGETDYEARLSPAPQCRRVWTIKTSDLDPAVPADVACMVSSVATLSGIDAPGINASAGNSMCANTQWNVRAEVTDVATGTEVAVTQGVGVRVAATDATDYCK